MIDLVCRQCHLSPLDAVRELNREYRLGPDLDAPVDSERIRKEIQQRGRLREQRELFDLWKKNSFLILSAYFRALRGWRREFAPKTAHEPLDSRFAEALQQLDYMDYLLGEVYLNGSRETKTNFLLAHQGMIRAIEQRLLKGGMPYAGRTGAGSGAAAPFRPVVVESGPRPQRAA